MKCNQSQSFYRQQEQTRQLIGERKKSNQGCGIATTIGQSSAVHRHQRMSQTAMSRRLHEWRS